MLKFQIKMGENKNMANYEPEIPLYQKIINACKDYTPLKVAVIHPTSKHALEGAISASEKGFIIPTLVGNQSVIQKVADDAELDIYAHTIIHTENAETSLKMIAELVTKGQIDAIMKGHLHTHELMEAVLHKDNGLRTDRWMSHVFIIDIPSEHYPKPLFLSDAAINVQPTLAQKKDIIQNAIDLFRAYKDKTPKVAILSATEHITETIPATLHAAALCKMAERGQISGGIIDGPLAFDNAISKVAAEAKSINSQVAGDADILITPDLESGNMLYKQMKFLSGYNAAGIVIGASVPIILTSRAGGIQARLASIALALAYVNNKNSATLMTKKQK